MVVARKKGFVSTAAVVAAVLVVGSVATLGLVGAGVGALVGTAVDAFDIVTADCRRGGDRAAAVGARCG
ncbi:MAG: hypothetical protein AB7U83_07765 [Vicinamibacterales bacterium]